MASIIVTNRGEGDITEKNSFHITKIASMEVENSYRLDFIFVPFWSWRIPRQIYENWNVVIFHSGDVPYGRGGSPIQNLIVRGYTNTVITAMKCVGELDAGPVYMKEFLDLHGTADEIYDRADRIIRKKMIPYIEKYHPKPHPQETVVFDRWRCTKDDVLRALETDYERVDSGSASR